MNEPKMYEEAIKFHKVMLPVFLCICILFWLVGCDQSEPGCPAPPNVDIIYNVDVLKDLCESLDEGEIFDLNSVSQLHYNKSLCLITFKKEKYNE